MVKAAQKADLKEPIDQLQSKDVEKVVFMAVATFTGELRKFESKERLKFRRRICR